MRGKAFDDRPGALEDVRVAAAHHGQHTVPGARFTAGYRRVDEVETAGIGGGAEFARHVGGGSRVVDEDRARLHAGKRAVLTDRDGAQVIVVSDTGEDEIGAVGGFLRRRGHGAAELLDPFPGLGCRAVVDRDVVAALDRQVARHVVPHYAKADECRLCHLRSPLRLSERDIT